MSPSSKRADVTFGIALAQASGAFREAALLALSVQMQVLRVKYRQNARYALMHAKQLRATGRGFWAKRWLRRAEHWRKLSNDLLRDATDA